MNKAPVLYIVVPCYNEEEVLPETSSRLIAFTDALIAERQIDASSRILFVDDGSKDKTWQLIEGLAARAERVEGLKLAHNAGHQNALWAGMMSVRGKADASEYIVKDSFVLTSQRDIFLYSTVTRVPIPKNTSSNSGGSRGGASGRF